MAEKFLRQIPKAAGLRIAVEKIPEVSCQKSDFRFQTLDVKVKSLNVPIFLLIASGTLCDH